MKVKKKSKFSKIKNRFNQNIIKSSAFLSDKYLINA
jgi:hypothetical protein